MWPVKKCDMAQIKYCIEMRWQNKNLLLSLMLDRTVFRWGLSSSSISSKPRTLMAPKALFRLSVGRRGNVGQKSLLGSDAVWEHRAYEGHYC